METEIKLCECGCGQPVHRRYSKSQRFITGHNRVTHGQQRDFAHTREITSFFAAKYRCTNPNRPEWKHYGGRGIKFLFTSFEQFFAELGPRPEGCELDRFPNNNGNYEPGNVRWAGRREQLANRRRYKTRKDKGCHRAVLLGA